MGNSALGRGTAIEENKVKASSGDATPDFLDGKVDGDTINVVGDLLERPIQKFIGTFSRTNTDADSTQAITGIGFEPVYIHFQSNVNLDAAFSVGFSDAVTDKGKSHNHNEVADDFENRASGCIASRMGSSIANNATVQSMDADGFTVDWVKQGAPTGVTVVNFIAIR